VKGRVDPPSASGVTFLPTPVSKLMHLLQPQLRIYQRGPLP